MLKKSLKRISLLATIFAISVLPFSSSAAEVTQEQIKGLDEQVQDIKADVLGLTTELSLLEEKLLFPSNTQISLFVSLDSGKAFTSMPCRSSWTARWSPSIYTLLKNLRL